MPTRGAELVVHIITDASKAAQGVDEAITGYSKFEQSIQNLAGPAALVLGGIVSLGALSFNAAAQASTEAAAAQDELKKSMTELGVAIGTALLPVMLPLIDALVKVMEWVTKNIDWISKLVLVIGAVAAVILALNAAMVIARAVSAAWSAITTVVTAAQWLLNAALLANPIGLVIAAIVALIAVFVILWNNCEGFRNFWIGLWEQLKASVQAVVDWFTPAWEVVVALFENRLARAIEKVTNVLDLLKQIGTAALNALLAPINAIVSAFQRVASMVQNVLNLISRIRIPNLGGLSAFAANSVVLLAPAVAVTPYGATSPTGSKSAVPPVSRGAASGGTVINITVNGALDAQSVSRQIARMLRVREGRVGLSVAAGRRA